MKRHEVLTFEPNFKKNAEAQTKTLRFDSLENLNKYNQPNHG